LEVLNFFSPISKLAKLFWRVRKTLKRASRKLENCYKSAAQPFSMDILRDEWPKEASKNKRVNLFYNHLPKSTFVPFEN